MGVLGGSYKEFPIYFIFLIIFTLIALGYFDNNPLLILLSIFLLIFIYIYLNGKKRLTIYENKK